MTALDINEDYLDYLQSKYPDSNINTKVGDMNSGFGGLRNSAFAGVTTLWANRAIADFPAFTSRVYNLLQPEGVFIWPIFTSERLAEAGRQMPSTQELKEEVKGRFGNVAEGRVPLITAFRRGIEIFGRPQVLVARK